MARAGKLSRGTFTSSCTWIQCRWPWTCSPGGLPSLSIHSIWQLVTLDGCVVGVGCSFLWIIPSHFPICNQGFVQTVSQNKIFIPSRLKPNGSFVLGTIKNHMKSDFCRLRQPLKGSLNGISIGCISLFSTAMVFDSLWCNFTWRKNQCARLRKVLLTVQSWTKWKRQKQ